MTETHLRASLITIIDGINNTATIQSNPNARMGNRVKSRSCEMLTQLVAQLHANISQNVGQCGPRLLITWPPWARVPLDWRLQG
jgi:hypothetical protein